MCKNLGEMCFILRVSCSDWLRKMLKQGTARTVVDQWGQMALRSWTCPRSGFCCVRGNEDGKGEAEIGTGNTRQVPVQTDTSPGV